MALILNKEGDKPEMLIVALAGPTHVEMMLICAIVPNEVVIAVELGAICNAPVAVHVTPSP